MPQELLNRLNGFAPKSVKQVRVREFMIQHIHDPAYRAAVELVTG